jgi:hypothetical protein
MKLLNIHNYFAVKEFMKEDGWIYIRPLSKMWPSDLKRILELQQKHKKWFNYIQWLWMGKNDE